MRDNEIRKYSIRGIDIDIELDDNVFAPPKEVPISAKHLKINKGETVIDIGTGSGILAIIAAKLGGYAYATDKSRSAIEMASKNAYRNQVHVKFKVGEYFASYMGKFDVIVANLSQTIIPPEYIGLPGFDSVDGGPEGNEKVLKLLEEAVTYMHKKSRMYVNVYTISSYKETIDQIFSNYNVESIARQPEEVKSFVNDRLDWYLELNELGEIQMFRDDKRNVWMANQYFFELTLK